MIVLGRDRVQTATSYAYHARGRGAGGGSEGDLTDVHTDYITGPCPPREGGQAAEVVDRNGSCKWVYPAAERGLSDVTQAANFTGTNNRQLRIRGVPGPTTNVGTRVLYRRCAHIRSPGLFVPIMRVAGCVRIWIRLHLPTLVYRSVPE